MSMTVVNDTIGEKDETVIVTLSGPTNATFGTNTTYTYTIPDTIHVDHMFFRSQR
jgi:hypothetical protein